MTDPYVAASYDAADAFVPSNLLTGGPVTTRKITILSGNNLAKGSVLGKILAAASATVTPGTPVSGSGGTVGNGAVGTWTADAGAAEGTWYLRILNAAANAGSYEVRRPDGTVDGIGTVAVAYNGQINGTLADGANDWIEDDYVPIVVSYAAGLKYKLSLAAATDGSQYPDMVLAHDADATSADLEAIAYETADVVGSALVLGTGHTITSIRAGLRAKGITIDD
jgi:Bacteriophage lambda head decoration protein D